MANPAPKIAVQAPRKDPGSLSAALVGDEIGFDAWLLQPLQPDRLERVIQLVSFVAGPAALGLASIALMRLLA